METVSSQFTPIKLPKIKYIIRKKGYYIAIITWAGSDDRYEETKLRVDFEVVKGKYKGFKLWTRFSSNYRSLARLAWLCKSVGILGEELKSPDHLIGKKVRLRVVPVENEYPKRGYRYKITRFHPVEP